VDSIRQSEAVMHVLLDQQHRLPAVGAGAEGRVSVCWFRREGDVRGAGFNANVESAIWYAPGSERRSEMRRTILSIVVAPRAVADPRLG